MPCATGPPAPSSAPTAATTSARSRPVARSCSNSGTSPATSTGTDSTPGLGRPPRRPLAPPPPPPHDRTRDRQLRALRLRRRPTSDRQLLLGRSLRHLA